MIDKTKCAKCGSKDLLPAYIGCWPFKGYFCEYCEEVGEYWNPLTKLLWDLLVYPWWDGRVAVKETR